MLAINANDRQERFDAVFLEHHQTVYRYCVRRLGPTDAEDAAAEVLAVAWRRIDQVPSGEATRPWLIGVAYKVIGNRLRSRRRQASLADRFRMLMVAETEPPATADDDAMTQVRLALDGLRSVDRELLRLSAWDDLSRGEIARMFGITENAVDQRLHRARRRLKARLDRLGVTPHPFEPEEIPT